MTIRATYPCQHCQKEITYSGEPVFCECGHGSMAVVVSVHRAAQEAPNEGQEQAEGGGDASDAGRQDDAG